MLNIINVEDYSSSSLNIIRIENSSKINKEQHHLLAKKLNQVSLSEKNILTRTHEYYLSQIKRGLVNFAFIGKTLVGSVNLNIISNHSAEISSAWVDINYRSMGIYTRLKETIIEHGDLLGYAIIATTKVSSSNPSSLISSFSKGIFPVCFSSLKNLDYQGYKNCCCCSNNENYIKCSHRNTKCILSKKVDSIDHIWDVLSFISSDHWSNSNLDRNTRTLLFKHISFKRSKLLKIR